ncbi:hypothetical protein PMAYCL1PPCAC_17574 [Pristionchus mayeri]|uniref:Proline-rich protein PRCC n=1 Tax=Pristionchus mayeri TaxID=1317129 RepID=A0AAN5CN67_9BILA|nr:hypothetical protein PMAYCL1PPCAC_17574 [Pristionchus mayeri]
MMGLVDYGSGSGSDSDDSGDEGLPSGVLVQNPTKGVSAPVGSAKPEKSMASSLEDAGFFGDELDEDEEEGSKLFLPAARSTNRPSGEVEEDDIEDIAKPKEWEKKLAEKARRKLEKKALKKADKEKRKEEKRLKKEGNTEQKEETKKKRGPVRIDAFGGLKAAVEVEEEENQEQKSVPAPAPSSSSLKLLSMLPAPKTASRLAPSAKAASIMVPPSLRGKAEQTAPVVKHPVKTLVSGVDSSDDEEGDGDFFGLSSTNELPNAVASHIPGVPLLPSYGLSDEAGPARPDPMDSSYGYEEAEEKEEGPSSSAGLKQISDEAAQNLIFKHDYAPFGYDRRGFADADIIDVSVDRAIGPNVQENLLKNLNRHNMARASMPSLPAAAAPKDKNAKRKHQITYLANIAVAREEELQQKWAEGKAAKRMARQKYGF